MNCDFHLELPFPFSLYNACCCINSHFKVQCTCKKYVFSVSSILYCFYHKENCDFTHLAEKGHDVHVGNLHQLLEPSNLLGSLRVQREHFLFKHHIALFLKCHFLRIFSWRKVSDSSEFSTLLTSVKFWKGAERTFSISWKFCFLLWSINPGVAQGFC